MKKGLNEIERFCLAGFFITHDADMAYKLSRKQKPCATDDNIHRLALRKKITMKTEIKRQ